MYPGEPQASPRERPTSVTVIAILAIVFGALGLICTPIGLLPYVSGMGGPNPIVDAVKGSTLLFAWTMFQMFVGFVLSGLAVIGGIGCLGLKNWGRMLLLGQAAVSLLLAVVGSAVTLIALMPIMREMGGPGMVGGLVGTACGLVLSFVVNGLILFFLTRPHVKAAFQA